MGVTSVKHDSELIKNRTYPRVTDLTDICDDGCISNFTLASLMQCFTDDATVLSLLCQNVCFRTKAVCKTCPLFLKVYLDEKEIVRCKTPCFINRLRMK